MRAGRQEGRQGGQEDVDLHRSKNLAPKEDTKACSTLRGTGKKKKITHP
jgi:hypothetical protein